MRRFGLIGYPISHSFSPGYFKEKFKLFKINDATYDLYPLDNIDKFEELTKSDIQGVNVTIPYKEQVIPFLNQLSPEAEEIGAVNVIDLRNDKRIGHNTDAFGFAHSLMPLWGSDKPSHALVLGTGGAAKAVWYVLNKLGISFKKVSRTKGDLTYNEISEDIIKTHRLIINTTPLGMSPYIKTYPNLPYHFIGEKHILFDLVYNPKQTTFLKKGIEKGAVIKNGLEMLQLQADRAWEIWNS